MEGLSVDRDIAFARIVHHLRKENIVKDLPKMPDATPADGIGAGTVALFLGIANASDSELVVCVALGCAALVASLVVICHQRLRIERNFTAREVANVVNAPVVMEDELDEPAE